MSQFRKLDKEGKGYLDIASAYSLLTGRGADIKEEQVKAFMNYRGTISFLSICRIANMLKKDENSNNSSQKDVDKCNKNKTEETNENETEIKKHEEETDCE